MTRPPVVVFTLWTGNPGGSENHTWRLCSRLRKRQDLDVRVVFWQHEGMLGERLRRDGVPVSALGLSAGLRGPLMYRRVGRLLDAWTPSVVVTNAYSWEHLVLRLARWMRPVVVVEHGGPLLNPHVFSLRRRLAYRAFRRAVAPRVAAEVCVSEYMRRRQESLPHAQRLVVIRNGVDTDVFVPTSRPLGAEDAIRVGAAGRLDPEKGFDVLIRAFGLVVARVGQPCTLAIAGDGSARQELMELVHRLDLDEVVSFVGRTSEMPAFWREQHLACVPSSLQWTESFGMVAAEAEATGLPVVASAAGGLAEVVRDGETGRLVQPSDVAQLAAALTEYVEDPGKIAHQGRQARAWALESLSLDRTAAEYASLIQELASAASEVARRGGREAPGGRPHG